MNNMKLFTDRAFPLSYDDVPAAFDSGRHRKLLEGANNTNSSMLDDRACDAIGAILFGDAVNMTCRCDVASETIDCRSGVAEVSIEMKDGELTSLETCASYCDENNAFVKSGCDRICIGDTFTANKKPTYCTASMNGNDCNKCTHHKSEDWRQIGSHFQDWEEDLKSWKYCRGSGSPEAEAEVIVIDCSNVGGRDYGSGYVSMYSYTFFCYGTIHPLDRNTKQAS